jgi:ribonuclease P protein component
MKFSESLKKNRDFRLVYGRGKSFGGKFFVFYALKNNLEKNRLGITVSKKVGNSVVRHRVTRLVREAYRLNEDKFACGFDFVILARAGAKELTYQETEQDLLRFAEKKC